MSDIPNFKSPEDEQTYYEIYEDKLLQYKFLMDKVRELLFDGRGSGSYLNVPGTMMDVINRITMSLIYTTTEEFTQKHSEYREKSDYSYVRHSDLKKVIKESILEIQSEPHQFGLGDK